MKTRKSFFLLGIVAVLLIGCQAEIQDVHTDSFNHPSWSHNLGIYEVNIRQYTDKGTFKAFEEHLPRLKELGAGILWLMPVNPIGKLNRKGSLGSYYSVSDYKAVNPEFGSGEDFRNLVKRIHELGMYVIIDWVANHSAWDNVWVKDHPDFYTSDSLNNFMPPEGTDWSDVIEFNYNNPKLREYMLDALKYWVKEFDIDGYRCDVAAMVPADFWDNVRAELDKIKPVFMLAEAHEPELHESAFDMTYNWQLKDIMNGIAAGENNALDLSDHIKVENKEYPKHAYRMTFTTNHDENSWNGTVYERLGKGAETFAVLTGTTEGMMLVYSGLESGLDKRLSFFEKDLIEWKDHPNFELYKKLYGLKKKNKALWNGEKGGQIEIINTNNVDDVFCFVREMDGNKVFCIFNLSSDDNTVTVSSERIKGSYTDLFTNLKTDLSAIETFDLYGWDYNVLYY
ncbi:MAG: alpha-glucosidase C-terminal domain-containing protein [Melioribacteraceae bacterium]|nr:alpha-glucosidase C-terminal domain-containing protein [Melioribacteraceae bacterium]